jgi:hypothetical protein
MEMMDQGRSMHFTMTQWRFPLILAVFLALLFAKHPPYLGGDVVEYTLDTVALASHGSADIRLSDIDRAKTLAPALGGVYDTLAADMRAGKDKVYPAFIRGREGKVYSIHFFGYSALAALPFKALDLLHGAPLRAFQLVNLAAVFVLGLALRRFFGCGRKALAGVMLFLLCGGLLYCYWTSPECVAAASLLAGLLLFSSGAPVAGAMLAGLAGQQNPTIVFFFAFAPLLLALQRYRDGAALTAAVRSVLTRRNMLGLALGAAVFALPPLFNLYQFGVPNIIARLFSDARLVGLVRLESFFFDLNQGMILAVPAVLAALLAWGWGRGRAARAQALVLGACLAFTLALALPALAVLNWNSGAAGVMRYAFWAAMPFLFALLLRLREHARWPGAVIGLVAATQCAFMYHDSLYGYTAFSPIARVVLQRAPDLYHPEPEIFAERMAGNDDYIQPDKVYVYKVSGRAVKTLLNAANPAADALLCGDGGAIAPDNRGAASTRGWRYIDGPVRCLEGGLPRLRFGADQFDAGAGVNLSSGWNKVEHNGGAWNGVWSDGAASRLVITPARDLQPTLLGLSGNYLDGNQRTRVTVNGVDLGWHQLDQEGPLPLPASVTAAAVITIDLAHEAPHAPGPGDRRALAFFLREVSLSGAGTGATAHR